MLAALIFAGAVQIWQLVVIEAVFGAAQAFFQPAYSGLLPQTVPERLIQDARALTETVENLAFLIGPALATGAGARGRRLARRSRSTPRRSWSARCCWRGVHPRHAASDEAPAQHRARRAARRLARGPLAHAGCG